MCIYNTYIHTYILDLPFIYTSITGREHIRRRALAQEPNGFILYTLFYFIYLFIHLFFFFTCCDSVEIINFFNFPLLFSFQHFSLMEK